MSATELTPYRDFLIDDIPNHIMDFTNMGDTIELWYNGSTYQLYVKFSDLSQPFSIDGKYCINSNEEEGESENDFYFIEYINGNTTEEEYYLNAFGTSIDFNKVNVINTSFLCQDLSIEIGTNLWKLDFNLQRQRVPTNTPQTFLALSGFLYN